MAAFRYRAVTAGGELHEGQIEAANREVAVARLQAGGSYPISVERDREAADGARKATPVLRFGERASSKDLATFTRELSTLLASGMPLDRSLVVLGEITPSRRLKANVFGALDRIRGGMPFADALQAQGRTFSWLYISMVRAGEAGGTLDSVLDRLADYLEKAQELRETVISALIYPAILLFVAVGSLLLLLTQVVPQFTELFRDSGAALPTSTLVVIAVGDWTREWWWLTMLAIAVGIACFRIALRTPAIRLAWHRLVLSIPITGSLVRKVEVARVSRTLGTLLSNGVVLLTALRIARETITNQAIGDGFGRLTESIKQGRGLAEPLGTSGLFPPLAVHMIRVGEETGQMEAMLTRVADVYEREVTLAIKRALALLEPILILLLGLIIAGIIVSVLLAVLSINELAF